MNTLVFERVEQKYLLNKEQYDNLLKNINSHLEKDKYYKSTICNIYFDTDNYDLVVESLEKPLYKEKVRLRSYNVPELDSDVFLEIKKKYEGVVGKRRIALKLKDFYNYMETGHVNSNNKQIAEEIDYALRHYNLKPKMFLAYDRLSYYDKDNINFRITFDTNVRSRESDLYLEHGDKGEYYFKDEKVIMELKTLGSLPLWFTHILSDLKIYPTSFSKYGNIYSDKKKEEIYV